MDPASPGEWIQISLLLIVTLRAFWGWVFGQESSDADHTREIEKHQRELDRQRERLHDLGTTISRLTVQIAVLEDRITALRERTHSLEAWRNDRS